MGIHEDPRPETPAVLVSEGRAIGPIGTDSRVVVGAGLIAVAVTLEGLSWWDLAAAVTVLPAITVVAAALSRVTGPVLGALAVIAVVLGFGTLLTFVTLVNRGALFLFVGLVMLLAALRGERGCELLTVSNLILRRRDAVWCPIHGPVDDAEARALARGARSPLTAARPSARTAGLRRLR